MGFYSSLPCVVTTALLLGLASTPLLRSADAPPTDLAVRVGTIDGLRGLLALAVFFHHAANGTNISSSASGALRRPAFTPILARRE